MNKKNAVNKAARRIVSDERGNMAIFTAFCLLPAILFIGGAVDVALAIKAKERLQAAADAGTLAAAALGYDATTDQRVGAAMQMFTTNTQTPQLFGVTPQISVSGASVTVTAGVDVPTNFLKLIRIDSFNVAATSVAAPSYNSTSSAGAKICLLALDPASEDGIHIQGDNDVRYEDCWAHTNSVAPTAINSDGSSARARGAGHCAVGGYVDIHGDFAPHPQTRCLNVPDPFATVSAYDPWRTYAPTFTPPSVSGACRSSNLTLKKGSYTLEPGRYCGGIDIKAQATVTFNPGVYIIDNGVLNVQSGANVSGEDVLFYFAGANATMTVIGGGTISLKGRNTGSSYAGFLFIARPEVGVTQVSNIQGGGTFNMEGMLYMPKQRIEVSGNGDVNGSSRLFGMIAKDFFFRGNGKFYLQKGENSTSLPEILPVMPTGQTLGRVSLN